MVDKVGFHVLRHDLVENGCVRSDHDGRHDHDHDHDNPPPNAV